MDAEQAFDAIANHAAHVLEPLAAPDREDVVGGLAAFFAERLDEMDFFETVPVSPRYL